jgi:hypothetical protein
MYLSVGLACLAVTYQVAVRDVRADWAPGLSMILGLDYKFAWAADGSCWRVEFSGWERHAIGDLPVPVEEVQFLSDDVMITIDDTAYRHSDVDGWLLIGQFPGGPVANKSDGWGGIKALHR